ncbi:hypothetical protein IPG36_02180 [bacterium]|nr:MAG: hypothetical protein IPG36_02180 [bacterium]
MHSVTHLTSTLIFRRIQPIIVHSAKMSDQSSPTSAMGRVRHDNPRYTGTFTTVIV